jgi:methylenetetrahydrofolate reductase (NADPH)
MDISLEIVPRSAASVKEDLKACRPFEAVTLINIPDLTRFSLRSWEACGILSADGPASALIPHLRARDFSLDGPFPLIDFFRKHGIVKALVISGDAEEEAADLHRPWASSPAVPFIKKLKAEMPELEIFAAFDPYRTNIRYELDYLAEKEAAGAAGFMSQPFFDLRLLEIYSEYLEGRRVFWGIAPVLGQGSRNYWESRNRTIFPKSFRADLPWNINFGRQVLEFCGRTHSNLYLMPVRVNVETYLLGMFEKAGK